MDTVTHKDIETIQHIHLVGIKGVAMTSLAQSFVDMGKTVSGSDAEEDFVTALQLKKLKISCMVGFLPEHITKDINLVVYSSANKGSLNPEVVRAKELGIPVLTHAQALGLLMENKKGISVCGVGGKTTTSAMLAWICSRAQKNPSFSVGVGDILNLGKTGTYVQESEWYIAEADEYANDSNVDKTPRFLFQYPTITVCTNLVYDHPDVYASFEDTKKAYLQFFSQIQKDGMLIVNGDDQELVSLAKHMSHIQVVTVGESLECDGVISQFVTKDQKTTAQLTIKEETITLTLRIPGIFNMKNAAYAYCAARAAGIASEDIREALEEFLGTMRRFEYKGDANGIKRYDDYAHHPSEIESTLIALKQWEPQKRIVVVFEPHTYSRTKALLEEFAQSLSLADEVFLLDIFASAREVVDPTISSDMVCEKIQEYKKPAQNLHTIQEATTFLQSHLKEGDVLITIGAGDVYKIHGQLDRSH